MPIASDSTQNPVADSTPVAVNTPGKCLSADEVCRRLGCCRTVLWYLTRRKKHAPPFARFGRRIVFPERLLEAWLEAEVRRARP